MSKSNVKELGENELLLELAYLDQAEYIDKQAYAQLVKIVEEYFKYKYLDNAPECYHVADQEQTVEKITIGGTTHYPGDVDVEIIYKADTESYPWEWLLNDSKKEEE